MTRISRRSALATLAAVAIALGASQLLVPGAVRAADNGRSSGNLDAPGAHRKAAAGEIVLIDIRRPEEWGATGSGEGAVRLDMRRSDFLEQVLQLVDGDPSRPVAVICARGNRSAWLSSKMAEVGFTSVIDVSEGMMGSDAGPGWLARGLPVVK